jgi:uncharacterized protein YqgV (UPF0045/DUF77 family)
MAKVLPLVRRSVLIEEDKVRKLMKTLKVKTESEAIRTAIDDRLFADEVMEHVRQLRRRGTIRDAYRRATRE